MRTTAMTTTTYRRPAIFDDVVSRYEAGTIGPEEAARRLLDALSRVFPTRAARAANDFDWDAWFRAFCDVADHVRATPFLPIEEVRGIVAAAPAPKRRHLALVR
jgi:hypothetical protein